MKLIVLRTGDVAEPVRVARGEFDVLIRDTVAEAWGGPWETIDVRRPDAPLPRVEEVAGFIVTGSSHSVTERAPWMLRVEAYLRDVVRADAPLLGICFGHQLLGQALGGEVTKNPRGREIGTVKLAVTRDAGVDPILAGLPRAFQVNATHVDTVSKLPADARVLATTELEPNAIFAIGENVRGVQFHPEIDADAMRGYVRARWDVIAKDGLDPEAIFGGIAETRENGQVLKNFVTGFVLPAAAKRRRRESA